LVEYQISTVALRADTGDEARIISTSIGSLGDITCDPDLHIVTCDATVGDLLVQMWIYLNTTEDIIDYIKVRRIKPIAGGVWSMTHLLQFDSLLMAQTQT